MYIYVVFVSNRNSIPHTQTLISRIRAKNRIFVFRYFFLLFSLLLLLCRYEEDEHIIKLPSLTNWNSKVYDEMKAADEYKKKEKNEGFNKAWKYKGKPAKKQKNKKTKNNLWHCRKMTIFISLHFISHFLVLSLCFRFLSMLKILFFVVFIASITISTLVFIIIFMHKTKLNEEQHKIQHPNSE